MTSSYRIDWIRKTFVYRSDIACARKHGSAITTDNAASEFALSECETQRASDQARSYDCDLADWHE